MSMLDGPEDDLSRDLVLEIVKKTMAGKISEKKGSETCKKLDEFSRRYYHNEMSYEELEKRSWELVNAL